MHRFGVSDLDAMFTALADATRRDIIRTLLHKPLRAGELAECVAMSPQALSRHLRVLRKDRTRRRARARGRCPGADL